MNKKYFRINFKIFKLWLAILNILLLPPIIHAGDLYLCRDQAGNESIADFPLDGQNCIKVETFKESTITEKENKATAPANNLITKVTIIGNRVFVPVTLVYDNREVNVSLLMDTGASGTVIHTDVADQFYINLWKTGKTKAGVVGGGVIDVNVVKMDIIKIGPHEIRNKYIGIVDHDVSNVKYDGLLGMDILKGLGYELDFAKQLITWK